MPTIQEIGQEIASQLRSAMLSDKFEKSASLTEHCSKMIDEDVRILAALKDVASRINQLEENGRPISEETKSRILEIAAINLGCTFESLHLTVKLAANNNHIEMIGAAANVVSQILGGGK